MWGWQQEDVKIRFFMMLLCVVVFFGCADSREKTMAAKISEHFKNYAKLKQNDNSAPKAVLENHQKVIKATQQQIEVLKAEGKDPKAVWTKAYTFDFSQISNLNDD